MLIKKKQTRRKIVNFLRRTLLDKVCYYCYLEEMGEKKMHKLLMETLMGEMGGPENLQSAFASVVEYLNQLNQILKTGSDEEVQTALDEYNALQMGLSQALEKFAGKTGVSKDALEAMFQNKEYFSEEDWEAMQEGKAEVGKIAIETPKLLEKKKENAGVTPKLKKPSDGKNRKKKSWVKS